MLRSFGRGGVERMQEEGITNQIYNAKWKDVRAMGDCN